MPKTAARRQHTYCWLRRSTGGKSKKQAEVLEPESDLDLRLDSRPPSKREEQGCERKGKERQAQSRIGATQKEKTNPTPRSQERGHIDEEGNACMRHAGLEASASASAGRTAGARVEGDGSTEVEGGGAAFEVSSTPAIMQLLQLLRIRQPRSAEPDAALAPRTRVEWLQFLFWSSDLKQLGIALAWGWHAGFLSSSPCCARPQQPTKGPKRSFPLPTILPDAFSKGYLCQFLLFSKYFLFFAWQNGVWPL